MPKYYKFIILSALIMIISVITFFVVKDKISFADTAKPLSIGELSASDNILINQAIDDIVKIRQEAQKDIETRQQQWLSKIGEKELDFAKLKGSIISKANKDLKSTDVVEKPDAKGQLAIDPKLRVYQFIEKPSQESTEKK